MQYLPTDLEALKQDGRDNGANTNGSMTAEVASQADATVEIPPTAQDVAEVCAKQDSAGSANETRKLDVDEREVHVPESVLDAWILQNLDVPDTRTARVDVLVAAAKPLRYEHVDVLMTLGNSYDRNVE